MGSEGNPDHRNDQQAGLSADAHLARDASVHVNGAVNGHADATVDELGANAAISFLGRFHPAARWALASFGPGDDEIGPAETFNPSTEKDAAFRFIYGLQGKHNIYFAVNCVGTALSKKAGKKDIGEIHYLHVDADLPKTLNWSDLAAVTAAKQLVLQRLRDHGPPPTVIVWSGGGFQAFWRLSEIIVVGGDKERMAPIERRMRRIEKTLGADPCHNADRIMRLPGTMNVLGVTKVRAGRKPERAELVEFHDDRIYDLEDFPDLETGNTRELRNDATHHAERGYDFERARDALQVIPADNYSRYLEIGMALMSEFGDAGFSLYREWAMKSIKYDENNIRAKWKSIKPEGGVTIATLFYIAQQHGWRDERRGSHSHNRDWHSDRAYEPETAGGAQPEPEPDVAPDISIVKRNRTAAPEFPIHVLGSAAEWVTTAAQSKSAPLDYAALGLIVVAAAMIGPKRRVSPWDGWEEPSIIWGAIIGDSSLVKSPSHDPHRDAVRALERELNVNWEDRKRVYENAKQVAEACRSKWEQDVKQAVKDGQQPPPMPDGAIEPRAPTRARIWSVDQTTEKAARILGENPDGIILFRDELAGWLGSFDKYGGSGSDRAFWLETYGGRPYRYERVSLDDPIDIQFCAVSLLCSAQADARRRSGCHS